ncbi:MAG TPA: hypothetical protein VN285_09885 [Candidatus Deferrimicrobium sp.]|nr:hypothetical protein [Candidatus Deferrimicrobium sp.]
MDYWSKIEPITKIGLVLVGVFYASGYFVMMLHLSTYGVMPTSALRFRYIVAGVWFLLPLVGGQLLLKSLVLRFWPYFKRLLKVPRSEFGSSVAGVVTLLTGAIVGGVFIGLLAIMLNIANPFEESFLNVSFFLAVYQILGVGAFVSFCWGKLWDYGRDLTVKQPEILAPEVGFTWNTRHRKVVGLYTKGIISAALILFAISLYASSFVEHVFRVLPYGMGGGKVERVSLVFTNRLAPDTALPLDSSRLATIPVDLVEITDDSYIVASDSSSVKSFEIPRLLVVACIRLSQTSSSPNEAKVRVPPLLDSSITVDSGSALLSNDSA